MIQEDIDRLVDQLHSNITALKDTEKNIAEGCNVVVKQISDMMGMKGLVDTYSLRIPTAYGFASFPHFDVFYFEDTENNEDEIFKLSALTKLEIANLQRRHIQQSGFFCYLVDNIDRISREIGRHVQLRQLPTLQQPDYTIVLTHFNGTKVQVTASSSGYNEGGVYRCNCTFPIYSNELITIAQKIFTEKIRNRGKN